MPNFAKIKSEYTQKIDVSENSQNIMHNLYNTDF